MTRSILLLLALAAVTPPPMAAQTFPAPLRALGSWLALDRRGQLEQGSEWRARFGGMARPGADLSRVADEWMHWLLSGADSPLATWRAEPYVSRAARLYARRLAGDDPAASEWDAEANIADAASRELDDDDAASAALTAAYACISAMLDGATIASPASVAAATAVEAAAARDGNYDGSNAAHTAARRLMANKLGALIAAK